MIVTFNDGTVARGGKAIKAYCEANGLDWDYWRRRSQRGISRRKGGPRKLRLPDDWRSRLDHIFGPEAVFEFIKEAPDRRPAIIVTANTTDTRWAQALGLVSAAMFLVRGRINYIDRATDIQLKGNPRGTIIWLLADNHGDLRRFAESLRPYGQTMIVKA